jgi:hypothetical protein
LGATLSTYCTSKQLIGVARFAYLPYRAVSDLNTGKTTTPAGKRRNDLRET